MLEIPSSTGFFKNKKLLIFDFDGTICNTEPVAISVFNELAREYNKNPITPDMIPMLKRKSAEEFIFKYLKISPWRLPFLVFKFRRKMNNRFNLLQPFPGIKELLRHLKNHGVKLAIISSSSKQNIFKFLKECDLDFFDQVSAGVGMFGKSKKIIKILKKTGVSKEDAVMIGDEIRDVQAGRKAGMDVISVGWGLQSIDALTKANAQIIVKNVNELESLLV